MAHGLDALRAGRPGVGDAALHIALLGVAVVVTRTLSRIWFFTPGRLAEFQLREDLFAHALRLQPGFYAGQTTGDLLSRVTSDVTYARAFAGFAVMQAINVVAALVMALGQMLALSPRLTAVSAVPVLLGFAIVQRGTGTMFGLQRAAQKQLAALSDRLLGAIQGVGTIQGYNVERVFVARLEEDAAALRATNLRMALLRALVFPVLTVAGGVCVWLLIAVGGPMALASELTAGQLAAFVSLVAYLIVPMRLLGVLFPVFQRSEASLERIHAVLDAEPERPEGATPAVPARAGGPCIELRDLCFRYPGASSDTLTGLNITLPAGATVGVFGRTGSGKTTLLRLLARLHNPPAGTVFVDGVDVTRLELDAWRRRLTVVPQSPFLFSETVRENIGFGLDDAAVLSAARAAALEPDLRALPDGLETLVGERGIVLSGGQRQRVALARGLARDADLVLMDDVLSAVDHATEQELVRTLRARGTGSGAPTRIIVSHRLSALEHADLVLVLEEGRLVGAGRHEELLAHPGPYREAWMAQRGAA
jgi:ATP-binding cassette subfamily B protein